MSMIIGLQKQNQKRQSNFAQCHTLTQDLVLWILKKLKYINVLPRLENFKNEQSKLATPH